MDRYYLDSSAYLAMLLGQKGGQSVAEELQDGFVCSSVLLVLEATRNLVRYAREGTLEPTKLQELLDRLRADVDRMVLRDLTLDLCSGLLMPAASTPRSLDLAHLRTALTFHSQAPLTRFVSLDAPQNQAARELGLPV